MVSKDGNKTFSHDLGYSQEMIPIAIAEYNEESWGIETLTPGAIFTHHFTDNLQGDGWEEFWMTFTQIVFTSTAVGFITGGIASAIFKFVSELSLGEYILAILGGVVLGATIFSLVCAIYVSLAAGGTIYDAALWGAKWDSYGGFFGIIWSAHAFIYNQQLAKEVTL